MRWQTDATLRFTPAIVFVLTLLSELATARAADTVRLAFSSFSATSAGYRQDYRRGCYVNVSQIDTASFEKFSGCGRRNDCRPNEVSSRIRFDPFKTLHSWKKASRSKVQAFKVQSFDSGLIPTARRT